MNIKNIVAAFVLTLAAIFPAASFAQTEECLTPRDVLDQAYAAGSGIVDGLIDQGLVRAKESVSEKENTPIEMFDFDRIEVYSHPNPGMYIMVRYKEGCAVGMDLIPVGMWEQLVKAARGTDVQGGPNAPRL